MLVAVTIPLPWVSRIPLLMPGVIPKSSALTMTRFMVEYPVTLAVITLKIPYERVCTSGG